MSGHGGSSVPTIVEAPGILLRLYIFVSHDISCAFISPSDSSGPLRWVLFLLLSLLGLSGYGASLAHYLDIDFALYY